MFSHGLGFLLMLKYQNDYFYNANQHALETLLAYNIEDSLKLEELMRISFNMKIGSLGFENFEKVTRYQSPTNLFEPHFETISKIKSKLSFNY